MEPPYIVVLTLLLIGGIFVAKTLNVAEGLKSYVASVFYVHNFVYPNELPKITVVAWSLEVEFKFYLLAPLMAFIFAVKSSKLRRIILVGLSLGFIAISHIFVLPLKSILYYFQYFLIGFLLVDFYVTGDVLFPKKSYDKVIALIAFSLIFLISSHGFSLQSIVLSSLRCVAIFVFYYYAILNKSFDFLSNKVVTAIGGMCYSIYLLHYAVISFFGNPILRLNFTSSLMVNKVLIAFILIALILLVSAVFYLLIERPCMKKDWYKNILSFRNK